MKSFPTIFPSVPVQQCPCVVQQAMRRSGMNAAKDMFSNINVGGSAGSDDDSGRYSRLKEHGGDGEGFSDIQVVFLPMCVRWSDVCLLAGVLLLDWTCSKM